MRYSDIAYDASGNPYIAATTAGISGTVTVATGARLRGINISFTGTGADIPQIIELTWAGSPTPLRFVPNIQSFLAGAPAGCGQLAMLSDIDGFCIPLDVVVSGTNKVTIKITSSGNVTCYVTLEWDA
jgi:hypothetical protein